MRKRLYGAGGVLGLLVLAVILGACAPNDGGGAPNPPLAGPIRIAEGFEFGMDGWEEGADVPEDPNRPGQPVAWSIEPSGERPMEGSRSVKFYLDGGQDDGTVWLVRAFDASPGQERVVNLSLNLWSESESFNTRALVAAYAGPRPPEVEADFDLSQPADQSSGWRRYDYTFRVLPGDTGRLWIALGLSAIWETEITYYLDSVEIEIEAVSLAEDTPTAPPPGGTPVAGTPANQEPEEQGLDVEPPPAILEIAGQAQVSGIGSFCWTEPAGAETAVGLCADMVGIPTAEEPLVVSSPFMATFRLAPAETPEELLLEVIPVTAADEFQAWPAGGRGWQFKPGQRHSLRLEREPSVDLSLEPGLYVLNLFARWQAWGDVSYGFLVEVQSPPPASQSPILAVDEYPIVAASVDGPGHFEYTDRLGDDNLTRIEGLRAYAAGQRLARSNAALAPFGYRLETRAVGPLDSEWDRTFYDLFREGEAEPTLSGLSQVWPVSVDASGSDFVLAAGTACPAAENAPNVLPLYLLVSATGVQEWAAEVSNWLPPAYVGDALARVTFTGFPTLTYQVELDNQAVYTGTAVAYGAYMPLRSFTTWDGHWALEVDDHLVVDGQDLGEALGYDAVFGFNLIHNHPFYFFEQDGQVRISYAGQTLPFVYDQVFHNQCCEAAVHNVEAHDDFVLFHTLWDGTWYFVEAGVYDGEMSSTYRYTAPEGWSFRYPMHWDRLDEELGFVQDTATGKTVSFASAPSSQAELERWLQAEIARKLAATEADNTLAEPLSGVQEDDLTVYRYAILSRMDGAEALLRTTVFFDGRRRYEFYAASPPVAEEEYAAILASFQPAQRP